MAIKNVIKVGKDILLVTRTITVRDGDGKANEVTVSGIVTAKEVAEKEAQFKAQTELARTELERLQKAFL